MGQNSLAIFAVILAGLSTGLGALPILVTSRFSKRFLEVGMGFSAGVMLVASFFALLLPGIEKAQQIFSSGLALILILLGFLAGYGGLIFLHRVVPHEHLIKREEQRHSREISRVWLIVLAICLHNLPEGMAVGVGFGQQDFSSGLYLAIAIALQNMPEGLVVAIGLISIGSSRTKAFVMALLSGMIEPVAAALGFLFTQSSAVSLPLALAFAAGAMIFVICQEMFPELFREGQERLASLGVLAGICVMISLDFLIL